MNPTTYTLEKKINAALSKMPADKRPEAPTRERIQSVAASTATHFEATTLNGHTVSIPMETAAKWLD